MEEKDQGRNPDDRADRRRERDARSSENATQMRHGSGQSSEYPVRTGVEDCYFYLKNGHCGYGRSCRFNHPPMRHDDMVQRSPYPGAGDCRKYLQTGKCSYGPKCRFNHPPTHLAPVPPERVNSRPLCKFFQRGDCKYGSGCKFTHSMREDGAEAMRQATTWGRKHGEESSSRPWKRERQARDLEEQKQNKRRVGNLRIGQRLEIPENSNVIAQENAREQEEIERQRREAEEKAQEERRLQIANQRREARLRLDRMRARALTDNVDQVRDTLKDIGIERKEGDGF